MAVESGENQVVLLFYSRFFWAPKAGKKTAPTDDFNYPIDLATNRAISNRID